MPMEQIQFALLLKRKLRNTLAVLFQLKVSKWEKTCTLRGVVLTNTPEFVRFELEIPEPEDFRSEVERLTRKT